MPALLAPARSHEAELLRSQGSGGGPTLEDALTSAWRQLQAGRPVTCAVCGGQMQPEPGAQGRCSDCGTTLS